ncbi:MAG: Hsp33 family molecular chaperone HslO, partial [Peptoniphilus lacrimalis]
MGYILKAIDKEEKVRFALAITTDLVEEARKIHNTSPTASAALGR